MTVTLILSYRILSYEMLTRNPRDSVTFQWCMHLLQKNKFDVSRSLEIYFCNE